jgi:membrane protease YdiL (CAAX protease family)
LLGISLWDGHGATALGFDLPLSAPGKWGLVFAVVLVTGLALFDYMYEKKMSGEKRAEILAKLKNVQMLPRTVAELAMFCVSAVFVSAGWEILYRGFLIMALTPVAGIVVAVALSAIAYGAAHGYSNPRQFILSIISALVFTIAFVMTHSLWWLILIHTAFAVQLAVSGFRMFSAPEPPAAVEC